MKKKKYNSKVFNIYKKQKLIKLLSVNYVFPFTAVFTFSLFIIGVLFAVIFKQFGLGGMFAGLGLSLGIASLTYVLASGENNSFVNNRLKKLNNDMEEVKKINYFEKEMYNNIQILVEQEEKTTKSKSLLQELTKKLKEAKQKQGDTQEIEFQISQATTEFRIENKNLKEQKSLIKKILKDYKTKNNQIQKLNPDLEIEYIGYMN